MSPTRKTRSSEEMYGEQLRGSILANAQREGRVAMVQPIVTSPEPLRTFSDSTSQGIYVLSDTNLDAGGMGNGSYDANHHNPPTLERQQMNRMSWVHMRRRKEDDAPMAPMASSPQTTRSYISTVSTSNGNTIGTIERGRTATGDSVAVSSGNSTGRGTISGSNHTLTDVHSDYHSHETGSHDYPYASSGTSPLKNHSNNGSFNMVNGSTVKLLPPVEDESNQQTKCSVIRGLVLCICLNLTYANVVRFPRELDKYGSAYLVPYVVLLFLVGLPIILLEISVGQFLGQGAAHTWRASPIFKGACIISRFASWLSTVWVSLQAVIALAYVGMFLFNTLPFRQCVDEVRIMQDQYMVTGKSGQECLHKTLLTPLWKNPLYFGLLSIGLICIWIVVMICTHNGKIVRRAFFLFGLVGFALLCSLTGWEVYNSVHRAHFPELWQFNVNLLQGSNIWFNALMQVLFATNCGFGALSMVTGKFLYKGDAVRTSVVYLCFNLLINVISVALFMVQFDLSGNNGNMVYELKPLTAVYDRIVCDRPSRELLVKLIPSLVYALVLIAAIVSITVAIYTTTRLVPRHPNYVISLVGLVVSIISLSAPKFLVARILDTRIVGTIVVTALIFDMIAVTWIYGAKNIYTDLEFSIGRPIFKGWIGLWCVCPAILTGLLVWWCSDDDQYDLLAEYMPRWAPIIFALGVIFIISCIQIFRQVEYNFFGMICEASKSAKEWGPADPLARHAWKQWRSVCQDTGRRDFTLRRRGTRDYTHSIKKGQYSTSNKYANGQTQQQNWKSSTPGNSSPNYSGSMFGDSAIEEDISVDKFHGITQQFVPFEANDGKPLRCSHRARPQQRHSTVPQHTTTHHVDRPANVDKHREVVYIRRLSGDGQQHTTRIEITPSNESITYAGARNPLARSGTIYGNASQIDQNRSAIVNVGLGGGAGHGPGSGSTGKLPTLTANGSAEHVCWRRMPTASKDYATEL